MYSCTPTDSASQFLIGKKTKSQDTRSGADVILHKKSSMLPAISAVTTSKLRGKSHPIRTFISSKCSGSQACRSLVHAGKDWK